MTRKATLAYGRRLLNKHGLHDWCFDVCDLCTHYYTAVDPKGFDGQISFKTKTIMVDQGVGRRLKQTILHEIAHAQVGRPGHDEEWLNAAASIGCGLSHLLPYALRWNLSEPRPRSTSV
jgi:hypothetical protein